MKKAADVAEVVETVLGYLVDKPDAEDTIDGIVEWWLMRQRIKYETGRVRAAMAELVSRGFVLERESAGSQMRYRINRQKLRAIRAFLKETSRKEKV